MENVMPIKAAIHQVTDGQTNNAAEIADSFDLGCVVKDKLKTPENHSYDDAHGGVEGKSMGIVDNATDAEVEDVAPVEDMLNNEPDTYARNS